jgi:N-methylhydantoinase A
MACAQTDIFFDDRFHESRLYRREQLEPGMAVRGPAMITEYSSATVLPPGFTAEVDGFGNLVIAVPEARA